MQGRHAETRRWAKTHGSRPGPSPVDASFAIHGFNLPLAVLSHMLAIGQHASCSFSVTSVCASVLESPTLKCPRSEEHTSELQSLTNLVCRLLLEKKKLHYHLAKLPRYRTQPVTCDTVWPTGL